MIQYYESDPSTVSWVGSLFLGIMSMCGPIVGGLANKFGLRLICIFGNILMSFGLCLSVLSPNIPILVLTFSVISGFGAGLVFLPAQVAVGYYFDEKKALANAIARIGVGLGKRCQFISCL